MSDSVASPQALLDGLGIVILRQRQDMLTSGDNRGSGAELIGQRKSFMPSSFRAELQSRCRLLPDTRCLRVNLF